MSGFHGVSVVVVNFNTRDKTIECLYSVMNQGLGDDLELILVDNGSTDGSAEAIRLAFPAMTVIEAGENLGFARGVNLGARHASKHFVLLLNPDTVVLPGAIEAMLDFADAHPQYRMYGGRTLRPDGSVDPSSCWGAPTLWSLTSYALGLSTAFSGSRVFDPESLGSWKRDSVREVPVITGCLLLMSRSDWDALGGMDETFFLYGEDAEFSLRARREGLRPVIVPSATIVHEVGGSTASAGTKMCMVMAGKATYLQKSWPASSARLGVSLLQFGALLRGTAERAARRAPSWGIVWDRRRDWRGGYPHAEAALFGRPVESERAR
ncbi:N/A [soil metagenome]